MQLALDAMGGDHAPGVIVAGTVQAVAADPQLRVVLVGDRARIEPHLKAEAAVRARVEVFHCSQRKHFHSPDAGPVTHQQ